jgi:hypothetical protein
VIAALLVASVYWSMHRGENEVADPTAVDHAEVVATSVRAMGDEDRTALDTLHSSPPQAPRQPGADTAHGTGAVDASTGQSTPTVDPNSLAGRLAKYLTAYEADPKSKALAVLSLSIAVQIEQRGCGEKFPPGETRKITPHARTTDPWTFNFNGVTYQFEAARFPEYRDVMMAAGSDLEVDAPERAGDPPVDFAARVMDPAFRARIIALAQDSLALSR